MNISSEIFLANQESIIQIQRVYGRHYGLRNSPSFENNSSVSDFPLRCGPCQVKNESVFEEKVREYLLEGGLNSFGSPRRYSNEFFKSMNLFPYLLE